MTQNSECQGRDPLLQSAVEFVRSRSDRHPTTAIILGSGLSGLADRIADPVAIPYAEIPGCGTSAASGHRGQLILGAIESTEVVVMAGRFHRYEGWTNEQIAFPVKLMSAIGATRLIVSNAAGGVSPKLRVGDILVIRDHINLLGGASGAPAGCTTGVPMRCGSLYDPQMSNIAMRVGIENQFNAYEGTYLATLGPNYETRSEYRMFRQFGADVVGMSTIPEVLAAADVKMRVLGLSLVANVANPDQAVKADHLEVLEAGRAAEIKMESIVRAVLLSVFSF
jgi:purine-nucleoside phosphorylase